MIYKCPICNGTGKVPNGFYTAIGVNEYSSSSATPEVCRSCNGTGIVSDKSCRGLGNDLKLRTIKWRSSLRQEQGK